MPRVSIVVPIYNPPLDLLERNLNSVFNQTFRDFEVVITDDSDGESLEPWLDTFFLKHIDSHPSTPNLRYIKHGGERGMANNTNHAMDQARGDLIKILYQDDYFYDESCLWDIVRHFTHFTQWMVTPCTHSFGDSRTFNNHRPFYSESDNTIGSPSVLTLRREIKERFDPQFGWVLDLDLYKRLYRKYGKPKITNKTNVVIGVGAHQESYRLSDERKTLEHQLLKEKYEHYPSA